MLKKQIFAALLYPLIVFPLAILWHLVLFKDQYMRFGYFEGAPNVGLGLISMIIQGAMLAILYPLFKPSKNGFSGAFLFAGLLGLFFWTSHVLALVAKQNVPQSGTFIAMETAYLGLQFGLFAVALGVVFPRPNRTSIRPEKTA